MRLKDTYKNRFKDKFRNDYFISFRNKNKGCKIAANIHKELEKEKYTNYYNPQQHNQEKAGYPKRLHRNVKHCKVFVWILTEDCMMAREDKPDYYFAEIIWAHKYNRCIVPVMSEEFKNNRIDNDLLKKQFYKAYDNLLKCNVLTPKDKKVVDNIVSRYCTDTSIWGGHDIPEEKPLSKKIVAEIIDRVRKTRWVNPVKNRWIKIPIIHTATFVAVVLVMGAVIAYVNMQDPTVWDGSTTVDGGWSSVEGNGTKESPYKIKTAKQLAWLSYTSQSDSYSGKHFELEADITLNSYAPGGILNNIGTFVSLDETEDNRIEDPDATHYWTPIGSKEYPFEGTFDGKGHMIYGLLIKDEQNYQGLFGVCGLESRITNVNVMCATIYASNATSYIGTIVGKTEGVINKCSVYSAFVCGGKEFIGGIAGEANIISNSFARLEVTGSTMQENSDENIKYKYGGYKGGVAGKCGYLINCGGSSLLEGEGQYIGGLVGKMTKGAYNCVELGVSVTLFSGNNYLENDEPIKFGNVLGAYDGNEKNYSNMYYNSSDLIYTSFITTEQEAHYKKLKKKYPQFFKGLHIKIKDHPSFAFNYHDYSETSGEYNKISLPIYFSRITNQLNKGVDDVQTNRSDIVKILNEYKINGEPIKLERWIESSNYKGLYYDCAKSPWLKNVEAVRKNWEGSFDN